MKKIKAACICQTLHFMLKPGIPHDQAIESVQDELVRYKSQLERSRTKYKILKETKEPDGSIIVECMQNKEKVQLVGFASFDVTEVPEKKEVNPETGELTLSTAYTKPVFKFSHSIRERINS